MDVLLITVAVKPVGAVSFVSATKSETIYHNFGHTSAVTDECAINGK